MPRAQRSPTLRFGQFFGTPEIGHDLSGFSIARIAATTPPRTVPDHTHETAHLVLVMAGDYVTTAMPMEPGRPPRLIYNPPGTTHADRFRRNHGVFFTLSVSDRQLESLRSERLPARPLAIASGPAVRIARRLTRVCESGPRRSRVRAEDLCFDLLLSLSHDAERSRPRPPPWLLATRETLSTAYGDAPPIHDLAATAAVHPVHLIRSFRRFFGVTPGEFLRERRLEAAAQLLRTADLPIVEIALRTGFADQSHFTRLFSRAHAISPAAFRRQELSRTSKRGLISDKKDD